MLALASIRIWKTEKLFWPVEKVSKSKKGCHVFAVLKRSGEPPGTPDAGLACAG